MISKFKSLLVTYFFIGALCVFGAGYFTYLYPDQSFLWLAIAILLIVLTMMVLSKIGRNKFKNEVLSYYMECNVHEYLRRIEKLMGKKRSRSDKSAYAYLTAMGYSALGDYDKALECAEKINVKSHKPEYYKRAADYYINKGEYELAGQNLAELSGLNDGIKSPAYHDQITIFVQQREYNIRIKQGILDGAEEFYTEYYNQCDDQALIVKVSLSAMLGDIILQKGDKERALPYLKFASENGGDTKYKKLSDELLAKIS